MTNLPSLAQLTVVFGLLGVFGAGIRHWRNRSKPSLEGLLGSLLAASSIPSGFFLLACAFDPTLIAQFEEVGLYLAAAGVALLYVSFKGLVQSS
jgi:hypothetical protein